MTQPPSFIHPQFTQHVCKLQKVLYGLKHAPCAWYSQLNNRLLELGFVGLCSESSLFIRYTAQHIVYILIYIDNILITLMTLLSKTWVPCIYFLDVIILSQQCCILALLHTSNMLEAKPINSPMSSAYSLSLFSGDPNCRSIHLSQPFWGTHIYLLQDQTFPILSKKSHNPCINPLFSTCKL